MDGRPGAVLWLCGPSGVGKSTVGWEIFTRLRRAGERVAFVDADQLGLCYPMSDLDSHRVKARNLGAVWRTFRARGVRRLVLSGIVEAPDLVGLYRDRVPGAAVTVCRLRAGRDTLRSRYLARGWRPDLVDQTLAEADAFDAAGLGDVTVETDGRPVPQVAEAVLALASASVPPVATAPVEAVDRPAVRRSPALWLHGPPAVGKSTVGWEVFMRVVGTGTVAAYVDLAQVGFCSPSDPEDPDGHRVRARNLGAMWPTFRAAGARCLIVTGRVGDRGALRLYADAVPDVDLTLCRLRAEPEELAARIRRRGDGGGPGIPGDELRGQPAEILDRYADRAARIAEALDRADLGGACVDTTGVSIEDVVADVRARTGGWPGRTVGA